MLGLAALMPVELVLFVFIYPSLCQPGVFQMYWTMIPISPNQHIWKVPVEDGCFKVTQYYFLKCWSFLLKFSGEISEAEITRNF